MIDMFDELGLDLLDNIKNYKSEHVDLCMFSKYIEMDSIPDQLKI